MLLYGSLLPSLSFLFSITQYIIFLIIMLRVHSRGWHLDPEHAIPDQFDASLIITQLFHIIVCLENICSVFWFGYTTNGAYCHNYHELVRVLFLEGCKRLTEVKSLKKARTKQDVNP